MLSTVHSPCSLPRAEADALNEESGRVYTDMLVQHYRRYRKQGVWLSPRLGERLEDALGGPTTLHAHSRDAAQQGFYKACKAAAAGIAVQLIDEAYTSQTCPRCMRRHKPKGRVRLVCSKPAQAGG